MTDEVAADDNHVSRRDELIIAEVLRCVVELYRAQCMADQKLEEHPHDSVYRSQIALMDFLTRTGPLVRDLGFAPPNSHLPGDAVARLLMAFTDLRRGVVDPVLEPPEELETSRSRHTLHLKERWDRVTPAVAMELLRMAGLGVKEAAEKTADMLKNDPILADVKGDPAGAITRWWRDIQAAEASAWERELFTEVVAEAKHQVQVRGRTAEDFIKFIVPGLLDPTRRHRK